MTRVKMPSTRREITHATLQAKRIVELTRRAESAETLHDALKVCSDALVKEVERLRIENAQLREQLRDR